MDLFTGLKGSLVHIFFDQVAMGVQLFVYSCRFSIEKMKDGGRIMNCL